MLRKKRAKRPKKVRKKCLNEQETLSYEQQIVDNNRQLARLRSRNEELEIEAKTLNRKYEQLQEDRADVVEHLKRSLVEKMEEARELHERLTAVEELRKEERVVYKKKEAAMQFEYRTMENTLSTELKLAAGKLNALDDWRLSRIDLMNKFEAQEKEIAKQGELNQTRLYETEKSVIISKAKMQSDMEERLRQLAQELSRATNIRIADVIHSTVKRNIALNRELNLMLKVCEDLETSSTEKKYNDLMLRLECELYQNEAKLAIGDAKKKKDVMYKIAQSHVDAHLLYGNLQRKNMRFKNYEQAINVYTTQHAAAQEKIKSLKRQIEDTKNIRGEVIKEVQLNCKKINKLEKILTNAKRSILDALKLKDICTNDTCGLCSIDEKEKIVYSLQSILEEHEISSTTKDVDLQASKAEP